MNYVVRVLTPDEYSAWDQMIMESPQASLFHTIPWNQMLVETEAVKQSWMPIVYECNGQLLGGILVRYVTLNGKRIATSPAFGYNGPVLASSLNYQERHTTFNSYQVLFRLLQYVKQTVDQALIYNPPEIWDVRAFQFLDWRIKTTYSHRMHCNKWKARWPGNDLQGQIFKDTVENYSLAECRNHEMKVQSFCKQATLRPNKGSYPSLSARTLEKRIHWMTERNLCNLVSLRDPDGKELAISLLILSKENKAVYLWKTVYPGHTSEVDILPFLTYWVRKSIPTDSERIDFFNSNNPAASRLKDQMALELIPSYVARY